MSRGSGETNSLGGPGGAFVAELKRLVGATNARAVPNPYAAVGLGGSLAQIVNAIGAGTKIPKLGAYHDSVRDGVRFVRSTMAELAETCPSTTQFLLVGYSQGAQVSADAYEELPLEQRIRVFGLVLFGDPYFNGESIHNQGTYRSGRHGFLGRREEFPEYSGGRVLSYCHEHDPICQGAVWRNGRLRIAIDPDVSRVAHKYVATLEPVAAARYLTTPYRRNDRLRTARIASAAEDAALRKEVQKLCDKGRRYWPTCSYTQGRIYALDPHYALVAGRYIDGHDQVILFRGALDGPFKLFGEPDGLYECPGFEYLRDRRAYHALGMCLERTKLCPRTDVCVSTGPADPDLVWQPGQFVVYEADRKTFAGLIVHMLHRQGALSSVSATRFYDRRGRRTAINGSGMGDPIQNSCGQWYWSTVRVHGRAGSFGLEPLPCGK